jgi:hypothetical protein
LGKRCVTPHIVAEELLGRVVHRLADGLGIRAPAGALTVTAAAMIARLDANTLAPVHRTELLK